MTSEFIQLNDLIDSKLGGVSSKVKRNDEIFVSNYRYFDSFTGNNSRADQTYLGSGISDGITIPLEVGKTYQFISNIRTSKTGSIAFYFLRLIDETTVYSIISRHELNTPGTGAYFQDTLDIFTLTATSTNIVLNFDLASDDALAITVTDWNIIVKELM